MPRFASHAGFCFICFDVDAVSLSDYLAGAKDVLELIASHSESGITIVEGAQQYAIRANWKLLAENSVDGYHALTAHASYLDYLKNMAGGLAPAPLSGRSFDLGNGPMRCSNTRRRGDDPSRNGCPCSGSRASTRWKTSTSACRLG